jgi:hypothetical protein
MSLRLRDSGIGAWPLQYFEVGHCAGRTEQYSALRIKNWFQGFCALAAIFKNLSIAGTPMETYREIL